MLNASLNKGKQDAAPVDANQEKMLKQYLAMGTGEEELQLGFEAEERSAINIDKLTN